MAKREQLVGRTRMIDELRDDELHNGVVISIDLGRCEWRIGPVDARDDAEVIETTSPAVIHYIEKIIAEMRRQAYKRRRVRPIVKPAGKPIARQPCAGCGGARWTEDVDGSFTECPLCHH